MRIAMVGDRIVSMGELDPVYLDRGIFFGDGVYEVVRSYSGRIFALEDHLARFSRSMSEIGIGGIAIDQVRERVLRAFEAADLEDARIYFHVTRGSAPRNHGWDEDMRPNFFLTVSEAPDATEDKQKGISVCTQPDWRWKRCDIKSLNLLANVLARQAAEKKGCKEAVLVDENGLITEGAGSSFFAVFGSKVQTAPLTANILASITRKYVVRLAGELGLEAAEESVRAEEAGEADELFLAVTTKDIIPVVEFDKNAIGHGRPGAVTKRLTEAFEKLRKR